MKKLIIAIVVIAVIALGVGVLIGRNNSNSTTPTPSPSPTATTTPPPAQSSTQGTVTGNITIRTMLFTPSQITVKKGEAVKWTNNDDTAHTVTIDHGTGPNSDLIQPGRTYTYTFNQTGSFQYHCSIHPSMRGTIVVK